ncbi:MAG: nitroreductase family protein [Planctomycetaceae bacterium]
MTKEAVTDHPIHDLIAKRWSPYAFAERMVSREDLCSLLEAARWAASSYNEQPWSYILATRDQTDAFERILSCLVDANQAWAKAAPVLMLCCTNHHFSRNGKPNAAAVHDLGLAAGNICAEATARGLSVHQMIGILPDKARQLYSIPEGVDAVTAMAIGYAADPRSLPDPLKERDTATRTRKPLAEFVFAGRWGEPSRSCLAHQSE